MIDGKKRILIVDDIAENIKVLASHLININDYVINIANDGLSAIDLASRISPDLILLDVMMPGIDGYETCRRLKSSPGTREAPIIFLTARHEIEDIVTGFNAGGADYVTKPFNSVELLSRIKTHLELKEKRDLLKEKMAVLADTQEALRLKVEQMEGEMERAHIIQEMFLPKKGPKASHYRTAFRYQPMETIGGDYITFPMPTEQGVGFFLGDLTGHGVSAALYMALIKFVSDQLIPNCVFCPSELLMKMNEQLQNQMQASFLTAIYGYLKLNEDDGNFTCTLAGAAHPAPILLHKASQTVEFIKLESSAAIGIFPEMTAENTVIELNSGDRLYIYTDGITEALNEDDQEFGAEALLAAVQESVLLESIDESLDYVLSRVDAFRGGYEVTDDITFICIEVI